MAGIYVVTDLQTEVTTGTPLYEIQTTSIMYPKLLEVEFSHLTNIAATAVLGIGLQQTPGTLVKDSLTLISPDLAPSVAPYFIMATDWINPPAIPSNFYRRFVLGSTVNTANRFRFKFPRGLSIPPGQSAVVWCVTGTIGNFVTASFVLEC